MSEHDAMEELMEEIADYLQASYAMGQHDYKLGIGYGKTPRKWDKDRAEKIITSVLSAVRDGLPLPDEQWRADFEGYIHTNKFGKKHGVIDGRLRDWEGIELEPTARLVALRGTGKEE